MTTPPTPPTDNLAAEGGPRSEMSEPIVNEPDRVILVGEWVSEVVHDVTFSGTENIAEIEAAE